MCTRRVERDAHFHRHFTNLRSGSLSCEGTSVKTNVTVEVKFVYLVLGESSEIFRMAQVGDRRNIERSNDDAELGICLG